MAGTLELENVLKNWMTQQDLAVDFFCSLRETVSPSRLRLALSGQRDLERDQLTRVQSLFDELRQIAAEHEPVPVAWRNPELFRTILESRCRSKNDMPTFYSIKINEIAGFFVRRERGGSIVRTPKLLEAAGMPQKTAEQVVEALKTLGHFPQLQINPLVSERNCAEDFADLWQQK